MFFSLSLCWKNVALKLFLLFQDLAKKFNETTQYKNMKQMLTSKNDQIKDLRSRLRKWVYVTPLALQQHVVTSNYLIPVAAF